MEDIEALFGIAASAVAIIASVVAITQSRSARAKSAESAAAISGLKQEITEIRLQAGRDLNQVQGDLHRLEQRIVVIQNRPVSGIFGDNMVANGCGEAGFKVTYESSEGRQ